MKKHINTILALILTVTLLVSCSPAKNGDVISTSNDGAAKITSNKGEKVKNDQSEAEKTYEVIDVVAFIPDTAIYLEDPSDDLVYIIDSITGEIITTIPIYNNSSAEYSFRGFENSLAVFINNDDKVFIDLSGKNVTSQIEDIIIRDRNYIYENDGLKGVKDKNGNIIIQAQYADLIGNTDMTFFAYSEVIGNNLGVLNEKGEKILTDFSGVLGTWTITADNILIDTELYSLPDGSLIKNYNEIEPFDDGSFLAYDFEDGHRRLNIIDSMGNITTDVLSTSPVSSEECYDIKLYSVRFSNENKWIQVEVKSSNNTTYQSFLNSKGDTLNGWIDTQGNEYSSPNGKAFVIRTDNGVRITTIDNELIGEFSDCDFQKGANYIGVIDSNGLIGLIFDDELKYPCEYTGTSLYGDNNEFITLEKGDTGLILTAASGAVIDLPI
jgi:hypothetical protein